MVSVFGVLPQVTWARILARVFEKAESQMGPFGTAEANHYRQWAAADRQWGLSAGPKHLGCPWRGCATRELPKGASGVAPYKPFHDDNNSMISLGFWTNLTSPATPTNLVFLLNGHKVSLRATKHRFVLFMGYVPHETAPADPSQSSSEPRVHH